IYYQMSAAFTKPVNISLTMANDSLLRSFLEEEGKHLEDTDYIETLREYLDGYRNKYHYDSVFLISAATGRYYNFNGLNRVLTQGDEENRWYYNLLESQADYEMNVDNDEANDDVVTVFVNCKLYDATGRTAGVVGVGLRIDGLQKLLRSYERDFGVAACFIDEEGVIQISPGYTGYDHVNFFDGPGSKDAVRARVLGFKTEGEADKLWVKGQTKEYYMVSRYLPELDWYLVVERDTGALIERMNMQMAVAVAVIVLVIVATLFVVSYVIRGFKRRIVALTRDTEQKRRTIFEKVTEELFENIYELDITHNRPANLETEEYFESLGAPAGTPYDKALYIVAEKQIKKEFQQGYIKTFSPENVLRAYQAGQEMLRYEFMISTGGDYYWMRITAKAVEWEDGSVHMLTYRQNIDAEKKQECKMQLLAETDEMTGLFTKTATQRHIEEALQKQPGPHTFFIFDIDNFKEANDHFGHAFGDEVIKDFAKILQKSFQPEDIVGRLGGDEFGAFKAIGGEKVEELCRTLCAELHKQYNKGEKSWRMVASFGAACSPQDGKDFKTLYYRADQALYEMKKRRKTDMFL
ncbi:MAG: sensor domain-containing diguanylate cyclase, partial [Oscillospiraceae bacterium]|nr:sensor domain-containing diguanylate cyclase [Oscillospiraceae bacterium]